MVASRQLDHSSSRIIDVPNYLKGNSLTDDAGWANIRVLGSDDVLVFELPGLA